MLSARTSSDPKPYFVRNEEGSHIFKSFAQRNLPTRTFLRIAWVVIYRLLNILYPISKNQINSTTSKLEEAVVTTVGFYNREILSSFYYNYYR
jgi:hypothetical protein